MKIPKIKISIDIHEEIEGINWNSLKSIRLNSLEAKFIEISISFFLDEKEELTFIGGQVF